MKEAALILVGMVGGAPVGALVLALAIVADRSTPRRGERAGTLLSTYPRSKGHKK